MKESTTEIGIVKVNQKEDGFRPRLDVLMREQHLCDNAQLRKLEADKIFERWVL